MNDFVYAEITPADVAELLAGANSLFEDYAEVNTRAVGEVVKVKLWRTSGEAKHFRAVVVEGETDPIVLERPEELGIQWHGGGGDLLALTRDGITLFPRGVDEWCLGADAAREMAAHLAAMADALEAAQAQTGGASDA